jgi:pimeloyl-ACP methyl ester carboxylesterase
MLDIAIPLGLIIGFILLHSLTLYLDRNYVASTVWLLLITAASLYFGISKLFQNHSLFDYLLAAAELILAAVFGIVFLAKLGIRDNWGRASNRLLRTVTSLDFPHDKFTVRTTDGVSISGFHVHSLPGNRYRKSVVILAHGGFRSKNILVKVLLAAWLSSKFDVIGFDFRGHGESSGVWTGDGKTVADLKAIVDYARQKGYQKIGVYGRSMGGWTAILEAVDYHDVDAIVVAGMPPGYFSEVPEFKGRISLIRIPGAAFFLRVLMGVRFKHFENDRNPIKEISNAAPVPILILYNETDPGAGVAGRIGHWETVQLQDRESSFRHIVNLPFTLDDVYNAAREPKAMYVLPGAVHVYSAAALRELYTQTDDWFTKYLISEPANAVQPTPGEFITQV